MFTDKVEIEVKAGKGGDGKLSFRHEKYREMGGPDGGDGGQGGNVIIQVDHNTSTLSHYRTNRQVKAENGESGGDNRKKGKSGEDTIIRVPAGTLVHEAPAQAARESRVKSQESGIADRAEPKLPATSYQLPPLADLTTDGQTAVLAKGGRGGFGNAHFKSSTRQSPRIAEVGEPGEAKQLILELKLVADVGLIGLPNAGKSTLLSVISNAKPEIADYPFTTLIPNLGVVDFDDNTFLVADIPGLIEGASLGKGLGDEFLRHIERTAVLLHLIDAQSPDPFKDWQTVNRELREYQTDMTNKPQIVVLTKIDAIDPKQLKGVMLSLSKHLKSASDPSTPLRSVQGDSMGIYAISAPAHRGIDELLRAVKPLVDAARTTRNAEREEEAIPVIDQISRPELWQVSEEAPGIFRLRGEQIQGFARRTNWDSEDGVERLRDILRKTGVARELERRGAKPGDIINIGDNELEWL